MPKKDIAITIRLSKLQLDNLKSEAKKYNIGVSEYIRRASIKGYYKNILNDSFYSDILYQINKIGNNLNQIAYKVNLSNKIELDSLKKLVSIEKILNSILLDISKYIKKC